MKKAFIIFLLIISGVVISGIRWFLLPVGTDRYHHQIQQNRYYDYQGIIHFHTGFSGDATGTFEEIARKAAEQEIDFLISTDHNTLKPLDEGKEGWHGKTLVLVGEELSLQEGYLLAFGHRSLENKIGVKTDEIMDSVQRQGGMLFIAHPDHPRWKWVKDDRGISGEEILDFADQWHGSSVFTVIESLLAYPFNWKASFLNMYQRPDLTLSHWDGKNRTEKLTGIFAPDFHQAVWITRSYKIPFPSAEKVLALARNHVLLENPLSGDLSHDKAMIYDALRKGRLFISMDILGNGAGFNFTALQAGREGWMGDVLSGGQKTDFSVAVPPFPGEGTPRIILYRNGIPLKSTPGFQMIYSDTEPGVYRVEVEVDIPLYMGGKRKVIWIYSNPVFLR